MKQKESILFRLTELMFKKQQTYLLLDELYEDEIIGSSIRNIQIDSPFQQLLFDGVLSQYIINDSVSISFTVEAYFQHLLAKVLEKDSQYTTPKSLLQLVKENKLKGVFEAVSYLLSLDLEKKYFGRLNDFIDRNEDVEDALNLCITPVIQSLLMNGVNNTIEILLENQTENDWILIQKCDEKLFHFEMHFLRNELTQFLINLKDQSNQLYFEIISKGISEFEYNNMLDVLNKLENSFIQKNSKILFNIGYCYEKIQIYDRALKYYQESLLLENDKNKPQIAMLYQKIAWNYYNLGELNLALKFNNDSLSIRKEIYGEMNEFVAHSLNDLGLVYDAMGDVNSGIEYIKKAILILSKVMGENIIDIGTSFYNLGNLYYTINDYINAIYNIEKAIKIYDKLIGENHVNLQYFFYSAALINLDQKKYSDSLCYFEKSLEITNRFLGKNHSESQETLKYIAYCYEFLNKLDFALSFYIQAAEIGKKNRVGDLNYQFIKEILDNILRLSLLLNKENELPDWIKNYKTE